MNIWRKRGRQRLGADESVLDRRDVLAELSRLLDQDLQERRRADIAGGLDGGDGVELQLGVADAARHDGAAQRLQRGLHHDAGRRQVIGEGVVDHVARPEAAGEHGAGAAEIIRLVGVDLEDRPGDMKTWRTLLIGTAISPPIGGFFFCTSPSMLLRNTGSFARAAREVTAAGSTSFSQPAKNGALALACAICAGKACISAFSRSAGGRVSRVS